MLTSFCYYHVSHMYTLVFGLLICRTCTILRNNMRGPKFSGLHGILLQLQLHLFVPCRAEAEKSETLCKTILVNGQLTCLIAQTSEKQFMQSKNALSFTLEHKRDYLGNASRFCERLGLYITQNIFTEGHKNVMFLNNSSLAY